MPMETYFSLKPLVDVSIPAVVAAACGLALGAEREMNRHAAGLRTLALISLGACLFSFCGRWLAESPFNSHGDIQVDPGRMASYVIAGVGFLGAGPIVNRATGTDGLTTAASIWASAAVGVLSGLGFVQVAMAATVLILCILWGLRSVSARLRGGPYCEGLVVLHAQHHLALAQLKLLLQDCTLKTEHTVVPTKDYWQIELTYKGDDAAALALLVKVSAIKGLEGAKPTVV